MLRKLGPAELRNLLVEGDLTPSGRRRAYDAIRALSDGEHRVQVGPRLALELADVDERIAARLDRLDAARRAWSRAAASRCYEARTVSRFT